LLRYRVDYGDADLTQEQVDLGTLSDLRDASYQILSGMVRGGYSHATLHVLLPTADHARSLALDLYEWSICAGQLVGAAIPGSMQQLQDRLTQSLRSQGSRL
jgi:predicted membrane-bound spermidine synthase